MAKEKIYMKEVEFGFLSLFEDVFKLNEKEYKEMLEKFLTFATEFLKKRAIELDYIDNKLYVGYKTPIEVDYGATTTTLILTKEKKAIQFTIDHIKVAWLSINPYLNLDDFAYEKIVKNKFLYALEMEYITFLDSDFIDKNKGVKKFLDILENDFYQNLGSSFLSPKNVAVIEEVVIPELEKEKVPKELIEQFKLTLDIVKMYNDDAIFLDIDERNSNIGLNKDKKIVLMDPVFTRALRAKKTSNAIHPLVLENLNSKIKQ